MNAPNNLTKRYYSIGEVADMFDVNASLLRYWESEFPQINPRKASGGKRLYTPSQIEIIYLIYILTKKKGYTLDGAKSSLQAFKNKRDQLLDLQSKLQSIEKKIKSVAKRLD